MVAAEEIAGDHGVTHAEVDAILEEVEAGEHQVRLLMGHVHFHDLAHAGDGGVVLAAEKAALAVGEQPLRGRKNGFVLECTIEVGDATRSPGFELTRGRTSENGDGLCVATGEGQAASEEQLRARVRSHRLVVSLDRRVGPPLLLQQLAEKEPSTR